MKKLPENSEEFLKESNAIEGVYDEASLQQALYAWEYLLSESLLSSRVVCKTHKILMLHQPMRPDEKGYFRKIEVRIAGRLGCPHTLVKEAMKIWCRDAMTSVAIPGANGIRIKHDHISYEQIHPFADGNGRTGRMFMNWQRLRSGLPILVIKARSRQTYYQWFK